eukprot:11578-Heterococcus_DN1.PRE.1
MPFTRQTISLVISAIRALQLRAIIGCPDFCACGHTQPLKHSMRCHHVIRCRPLYQLLASLVEALQQ